MKQLLLIDDDVELCALVTQYLQAEGFQVHAVHDGEEGIEQALSGNYALAILDVMLPGLNGFEVLRRITAQIDLPVLMLSARGEDVDRIVGLEVGAGDYLPKPVDPHELVARIRAILRRTGQSKLAGPGIVRHEVMRVGDVEMDKNAWKVQRSGELLGLTALEFNLLELFLRAAGRVLSREEMSKIILEREFDPFDRSLDMHVSNLRKKLGPHADGSERIRSVRGVGYLYTSSAQSQP